MLSVRLSIRARCTILCDQVCQRHATGCWFSPVPSVSSNNKTDRHDITEILLRVALNTIKQRSKQTNRSVLNNDYTSYRKMSIGVLNAENQPTRTSCLVYDEYSFRLNINIQSSLYIEVTTGTKKNWPYKTGDLLKEAQFIGNFL